jgi:hypothetical protein
LAILGSGVYPCVISIAGKDPVVEEVSAEGWLMKARGRGYGHSRNHDRPVVMVSLSASLSYFLHIPQETVHLLTDHDSMSLLAEH